MAHEHHHHGHHHHHHATENIATAFFLNLIFTIIEIIGGILTNSMAILSDALHDFGDSISLGLAWYFEKLSTKGRNEKFTYGYKRFSILGAVINSIILVVGSIFILFNAIPRFLHPQNVNAKGMIWLAILGVIINGAAVLKLQKGNSLNEKVVSLHLLEDVLGWVAVLIGSILMYFFDLPFIDPLLSILIAIFILYNVVSNLKESLKIILEGVPTEVNITKIETTLTDFPEINSIHDVHIWTMDGEYNLMTIHVVIKNEKKPEELATLKSKIRTTLHHLKIEHVTIEFETMNEECTLNEQC